MSLCGHQQFQGKWLRAASYIPLQTAAIFRQTTRYSTLQLLW